MQAVVDRSLAYLARSSSGWGLGAAPVPVAAAADAVGYLRVSTQVLSLERGGVERIGARCRFDPNIALY